MKNHFISHELKHASAKVWWKMNKITGTGGLVWSNLGIWPKTMSWAKFCDWCLGIGTKNIFSFLAVVVASKLEWDFVGDWVRGFRNTVSILSDGFKTYTPESKTPYKVVDARNWHHLMF